MPQGIIQVSPSAVEDFIDLTIDPALIDLGKLEEVLLLPERYTVEQVRHREFSILNGYVEVIVSSSDIPEIEESAKLPYVSPCYCYEHISEDGKTRTFFLFDILINGVSAIREKDKERKVTMEIKEVRDPHADARDTQFIGYAKALMAEILAQGDLIDLNRDDDEVVIAKCEQVIARRAYDLAHHVVENVSAYNMLSIPDLTELPKDKSP